MEAGTDEALARGALECDRAGGGVDAALGRLLSCLVDALDATAAGVDAPDEDGTLVPVARTEGAPSAPPALAASVLGERAPDSWRVSGDGPADVALPAVWDGEARGVTWLAGVRRALPPAASRALVDAATRVGALLEHRRVLGELDRAMVRGVAAEERLLARIGLDIHDGPTQQMSVALLEVQLLQAELADAAEEGVSVPEAVGPALGRIYETLGGALHELRDLIGTFRPAYFQAQSLESIVREAVAAFEARTSIAVPVETEGDTDADGITTTQRITFYRILQEALANAHRHGRARRAWVRLSAGATATTLEVSDDGIGFDPQAVIERGSDGMPEQVGLSGMRDRTRLLGGTFEIRSSPGAGTTVTVRIPRWHAMGASA